MKLFYKEPTHLGIATFYFIGIMIIEIALFVSVNDWWFRIGLLLITYLGFVKTYHKTYLYDEKIIVKYSRLKFGNNIKEIDYKDCLIFEDANGPYHSNNYTIIYRFEKEKKLIGFHILERSQVEKIIDFLVVKNNMIKIKAKIPNV